jgi:hypothetical protein
MTNLGSSPQCGLSEHLVTVVGTRSLRAGLSKRYWIRCRVCEFEHGPYDSWRAAWLDALGAQVAARRRPSELRPRRAR